MVSKEQAISAANLIDSLTYYTPSIEDIHVGYKCEVYGQSTTKLIKNISFHEVTVGLHMEVGKSVGINQIPNLIKKEYIRTPYLTKEQIEKEGWVEDTDHPIFSGSLSIKNDKATYLLRMIDKTNIRIIRYTKPDHNNIWKMQQRSTIYDGDCPSINEFRKIVKLLGIVK